METGSLVYMLHATYREGQSTPALLTRGWSRGGDRRAGGPAELGSRGV